MVDTRGIAIRANIKDGLLMSSVFFVVKNKVVAFDYKHDCVTDLLELINAISSTRAKLVIVPTPTKNGDYSYGLLLLIDERTVKLEVPVDKKATYTWELASEAAHVWDSSIHFSLYVVGTERSSVRDLGLHMTTDHLLELLKTTGDLPNYFPITRPDPRRENR